MQFGEMKIIPLVTMPPERAYSLYNGASGTTTWWKCREQFAPYFTDITKEILFTCKAGNQERIALFIERCEQILKISSSKLDHSKFSTTDKNFVLHVNPSEFWTAQEMRRQVFTILLRCGQFYEPKKDNVEEALWSEPYAVETKDAIIRFFFGCNNFITDSKYIDKIGWVNTFKGKTKEQIIKQLVKTADNNNEFDIYYNANFQDCLCV